MADLTLLTGELNTCAGSLQAWMLLHQARVGFEARARGAGSEAAHRDLPLPVLLVDDVPVWGTLAIAEFLAEHIAGLWPEDPRARAHARSIACEMYAEVRALTTFLPFDAAARYAPPGRLLRPVERDVGRVLARWNDCRRRYGADGPFLFGSPTIPDAICAPIVSRLVTYAVPVDPVSGRYLDTMLADPALQEWIERARLERLALRGATAGADAESSPDRPGVSRLGTSIAGPAPTAVSADEPQPVQERAPIAPSRRTPTGGAPALASKPERPTRASSTAPTLVKPIGAGTRRER